MKTLNNYINEWKVNTTTLSSIQETPYFIYKVREKSTIRIFDDEFELLKKFKNKVYINGKHIEITHDGLTVEKYEPGTYKVYIEDINDITDCTCMFQYCCELISVPFFDTSKVDSMEFMFKSCENLEKVPLLNTDKVDYMSDMFSDCYNLSDETKKEWSQIYDFTTDKRK